MHKLFSLLIVIWLSVVAAAQSLPPAALSPAEALARARQQHPLLIAAKQRTAMAEGELFEAALKPNPSLTVSGENFPLAPTANGFSFARSLDWFVTLTNTFETGNKRLLRQALAERAVEVARVEAAIVEERIGYEVKAAYAHAAAARLRIELAREAVKHWEQLTNLTAVRVNAGYTAEGDLIKTRLEAQRIGYALSQAELEFDRARIVLLQAMGEATFDADFDLAEGLDFQLAVLDPTALQQLQQAALRRPQPALAAARLARAQSLLQLETARARPDITTTFGYKRNGPDNALYGAVNIPLPIYNKNQGMIDRAQAEVKMAEAEAQHARNQVLGELAAARRAVAAHQRQVETLRGDFLRQADESQAVALTAYREGATSLLTLIEAQRARGQARELYFKALTDYRLSLHELERAAGLERLPLRDATEIKAQSEK